MDSLAFILICVLASVVVSLTVGYVLGRGKAAPPPVAPPSDNREQQAALATLLELLRSVEGLTSDVGTRSTEMQAVKSHVGDMHVEGELEVVRQILLTQVASVLESNQKLEDDLVYARCQMQEQAVELDRTRREANTDVLSGVANRKGLDEKLLLMLGGLKRGGEPFVLILADVDHFKWVNDTHGHQAGDNVLRELGELLKRCVRDGDFVGRYGGDEFAVLLPRVDLPLGIQVADRIRREAAKTNFGLNAESAVTLSLGLALAQPGDVPETIMARADQALYASKDGGRNQVHFQPTPDQETAAIQPAEAPAAEEPALAAV